MDVNNEVYSGVKKDGVQKEEQKGVKKEGNKGENEGIKPLHSSLQPVVRFTPQTQNDNMNAIQ